MAESVCADYVEAKWNAGQINTLHRMNREDEDVHMVWEDADI